MNTLRLLAANLRLLSHRTLTQHFWAMPNPLCTPIIQLRCYGRRRKQPDATRLTPPEGNQEKPKYVSYSNMSWPAAEKRLRVKFNKIERVPIEKMLGPTRKAPQAVKGAVYQHLVDFLKFEGVSVGQSLDGTKPKLVTWYCIRLDRSW